MPYKDVAKRRDYAKRYREDHPTLFEEYRETHRAEQRGYEADYRQRNRQSYDGRQGRQFVMCDGEGHGEGSDHRMYLFRAGDRQIKTGKPLTTFECLDFIAGLPYGPIYVIYYGTYDCTMILRELPWETLDDLMNRPGRAFPGKDGRIQYRRTTWNGFKLDYMPKKRLVVSYDRTNAKPITIHDVGGFFQEAFLSVKEDGTYDGAIIKWDQATPAEQDIIAKGKTARGTFDSLDDDVDEYNRVECVVGARLMSTLNDATHAVGLEASPYEGAGCLASSMFETYIAKPRRSRNEPPHPPKPPAEVPAIGAYYGGRFEITAHGPIRRPVYEYDICSAYPAVLRNMACLWHGNWRRGNVEGGIRLGYLHWEPRDNGRNNLGPIPVRSRDGRISFPLRGMGWYWDVEWPNESEYKVDVLDCWTFVRECDHKPYSWIDNLYAARKGMGKSGKGYVLKLGMNSLYGKTAQRVGEAPWSNAAIAGIITATTRRMLRDAAATNPDAIVMLATDGIYSLEPLDVPLSGELGGWEETVYPDMHIVQPGIYFSSDNAKVKTRGIARKTLMEYKQPIIEAFDTVNQLGTDHPGLEERWGTVVEYNGLITLRLAWSQRKPEKAGYFGKLTRAVRYTPAPKRPLTSLRLVDGIWRSDAPAGSNTAQSKPYKNVYVPDHDYEEMVDAAPDGQDAETYLLW